MYRLGGRLSRTILLVIYSISCFSHTITTFSEFGEDSNISENYFIVTAYYSPLLDQEDYITGSYAGDIRLNGSGIRGASGKEVFPGMIAAPKKYPFGTKIDIKGLGIGSVEDRGGAIIEATDGGPSHDRLDIWMGFGDEGRKRAIIWGSRKVEGSVVDDTSDITIAFTKNLGLEIFGSSIGPKSSEEDIKKLQQFLMSLKLYDGGIDGDHASVRDSMIEYQLKNNIISSKDDEEAGYFGPKTIQVIKKEFPAVLLSVSKKKPVIQKTTSTNETARFSSILKTNVNKTSSKEQIQELQKLLQFIGIYSGKQDGNYESIRENLVAYQIKNSIIPNKNSFGAGNFGPKTRQQIQKDLNKLVISPEKPIITTTKSTVTIPRQNITPTSKKEDIILLQQLMKEIGIYSGEVDGKYDSLKTSLIQYQKETGIIQDETDQAAGYWGPKTREKMNQKLKEVMNK